MCSSLEATGHTYVDRTGSEYRDGEGNQRIWQDCTGCGNVNNRRTAHLSNVKPAYFRQIFDRVRADSDQIREATSDYDTTPAARGTRYFLWSDGTNHAGFAIRADGELVYVFSTARGMGDALVAVAIEKGATHLDCFDGYLTRFYFRNGFDRVTSLPNWGPGPDVIYMARPGHYAAALDKAERA